MALQTREKRMLIGLAVVAVISAAILYRVYNPSVKESFSESASSTPSETRTQETSSSNSSGRVGGSGSARGSSGSQSASSAQGRHVSLEEFARHSKAEDCWVLIEGEIWDISNFIKANQSVQAKASSFCGTVAFEVGFLEENPSLTQKVRELSSIIGSIG